MEQNIVHFELLEGGKLPVYANFNDAGADVFAAEDLVLHPGECAVVPLRFKVALPDHLEMQVRPRSGLSLKTTLRIPNSPGTVDAGYRDEVGILVENTYNPALLPYALHRDPALRAKIEAEYRVVESTSKEAPGTLLHGFPPLLLDAEGHPYGSLRIHKGMKLAQVVFHQPVHVTFQMVDAVKDMGIDRNGGFGSTGI